MTILSWSDLARRRTGPRCWILGSGPSLDDVDLRALQGRDVIACNASIVMAFKVGAESIWHFHDVRAIHEVSAGLSSWRPWVVLTKAGAYEHVRRAAESSPVEAVFYDAGDLVHERTCVETAIQAAVKVGYSRIVLVGVDLAVIRGQVYADALRFKPCHFVGSELKVFAEMVKALSALKPRIKGADVVTCSATSPTGLFERVDFGTEAAS